VHGLLSHSVAIRKMKRCPTLDTCSTNSIWSSNNIQDQQDNKAYKCESANVYDCPLASCERVQAVRRFDRYQHVIVLRVYPEVVPKVAGPSRSAVQESPDNLSLRTVQANVACDAGTHTITNNAAEVTLASENWEPAARATKLAASKRLA